MGFPKAYTEHRFLRVAAESRVASSNATLRKGPQTVNCVNKTKKRYVVALRWRVLVALCVCWLWRVPARG